MRSDRFMMVELHVRTRHLVARTATETERFNLVSPQRVGWVGLLFLARLEGRRGGWVSSTDIVRRVRALAGREPRSIGKRVSEAFDRWASLRHIIDFQGVVTGGPWRLTVPSERLRIVDVDELRRLVLEDDSAKDDGAVAHDMTPGLLREVEGLVDSGAVGAVTAWVIEQFLRGPDASLSALAARIAAGRARRSGKLATARRLANHAVFFFAEAGPDALGDLAAAHNERGAVHYSSGWLDDALGDFGTELSVLGRIKDGAARARGLARCLRWSAFVLLRMGDLQNAQLRADEAVTYAVEANDAVAILLARAASLRVKVHSGRAREAARALVELVMSAPVAHTVAMLLARRFLVEALYAAREMERADQLAVGVFNDATRLGLVREADAATALMRHYSRHEALAALPAASRTLKRDRLNDLLLVAMARSRCQ